MHGILEFMSRALCLLSCIPFPTSLWIPAHSVLLFLTACVMCVMYVMGPWFSYFQITFSFTVSESILFIMGLYLYHWQREDRWKQTKNQESQIPEWTKRDEYNAPKLSVELPVSSVIITRLIWERFLKISYLFSMYCQYCEIKWCNTVAMIWMVLWF